MYESLCMSSSTSLNWISFMSIFHEMSPKVSMYSPRLSSNLHENDMSRKDLDEF